jgi:hypothetical protein
MNTLVIQRVSDSEINVKISLGGEQSVSCDEAENISNNSSMQPDIWANSGTERPHFPFTGKPGINVLSCFYVRHYGNNS